MKTEITPELVHALLSYVDAKAELHVQECRHSFHHDDATHERLAADSIKQRILGMIEPAPRQPDNSAEGDDQNAFREWYTGRFCASHYDAWMAGIAWERQQSTAREASLRERMKEAEAKLADMNADLSLSHTHVASLQTQYAQLKADKEQAVAKERAVCLSYFDGDDSDQVTLENVAQILDNSHRPQAATTIRNLHARLTSSSQGSEPAAAMEGAK